MINNNLSNQLSRFFNRGTDSGSTVNDVYKRLKAKHDAIHGKPAPTDEETAAAESDETNAKAGAGKVRSGHVWKQKTAAEKAKKEEAATEAKNDENLTPTERRKKELEAIMAKLNAEEEQRYGGRFANKGTASSSQSTDATTNVTTTTDPNEIRDRAGTLEFLNDMPLFNEFKSGLMDAFKRMDSATAGSVSAQYELNYTTMQYVADAGGNYEYKETSLSIKLDLNYIKAAAGGQTGKEIADAIGSSEDFASMVEKLQNIGKPTPAESAAFDPDSFMTSMKDYFSPEKTAGRIVDFATAFFPMSDAYKAKGDTEEARAEFAEMMRNAIQKGFDQAQGVLGVVPKETQDGIDKTHELTMKGIDDFIKNGLNKQKQDQGVYSALEQFSMSFEMSYSEKSVSVRNYDSRGHTQTGQQKSPALDTQA